MDIIDVSEELENISRVWKKFTVTAQNQKAVNIILNQEEYFSWIVAACSKKQEMNLIVCRDHVWGVKVVDDLRNNGLDNVVLIPSAWSQLTREEMSVLSEQISMILSEKKGYMVVTGEEVTDGFEYKWLEGFTIGVRENYRFSDLGNRLINAGYLRVSKLGEPGEFTVMGDIWRVWGIGENEPFILSFENNLLQKISIGSKSLSSVSFRGQLVRSAEKEDLTAWLNSLGIKTIINYGLEKKLEGLAGRSVLVNCLPADRPGSCLFPLDNIGWVIGGRENFLRVMEKKKPKINLVATAYKAEVKKWFFEEKLAGGNWKVLPAEMTIGGWLEEEKILIWTDRELFRQKKKNVIEKTKKEINWQKLIQFQIGDLVVHSDHGIGILKDFATKQIGEIIKDYFVVSYAKGDTLYVPIEQLNKLAKYVGSKLVKLSRLGSVVWGKRKRKALKQVERMAKELLRLYAKRKLIRRDPYLSGQEAIEKLDAGFGYELTDDQKKALEDINNDLEKNFPMDRLLCGDVGFGKTEIAIRASAKVAAMGKQVAILVPTTVLAEQHFITFSERLNEVGYKVEVLSRLRDKSYQKNVIKNLQAGRTKVLIGTHRLLQKDVGFKDLGLIVIDEEQKFGVRAKEQLKRFRTEIDVLSMSATPIPRTLNMSMGGVRDLSILETPPLGRRSVETSVMPFSAVVIKTAVERELARGGQVFVVHNRVRTIDNLVAELSDNLGKKVRIGVAHGQMSEKQLAMTMNKFAKQEYDVLVATTIVENGLDLPNVNTLIVENATGLGLSQLYQLRGRVGRSSTKAYAYFFYRSEKLKDKAKQRLDALAAARELGSGLKLAIADMEIRGVGNILGLQQHGNAYAIGLGMFLDMLGEMVERLKDNQTIESMGDDRDVILDLPVSFSVPKYYVEKVEERIVLEQKIAAQIDIGGLDDLEGNTIRRFGAMPEECRNLFKICRVKILAEKMDIAQILVKTQSMVNGQMEKNIHLIFNKEISLDWVQYLFTKSVSWVFRDREARINLDCLPKNLLDWLLDLLEGQKKIMS